MAKRAVKFLDYEIDRYDIESLAAGVGTRTRDSGSEIQFELCPICHGGRNRDKWTFAINSQSHLYQCLRSSCGRKGHFVSLAKELGYPLREHIQSGGYKPMPKRWYHVDDASVKLMERRGIPEEITRRYKILHIDDDRTPGLVLFTFFDENGEAITGKYRNMDFVKGVTPGAKEWFVSGTKPILYGMDQCGASGTLVITEGQLDALSLAAAGIENAVSVPGGAKNFKWCKYCYGFVSRFDEIVVFGDCEKDGITLVDGIAQNFQDKPIRVVQQEDYHGCKDANEIWMKYHDPDILRKAVESAQPDEIDGVVDLSEVAYVDVAAKPHIRTGFPKVDSAIGGLYLGDYYVVTGVTGKGKSTMVSQMIVNAIDQGHKVLLYSGESGLDDLKNTFSRQIAGASLIRTEYHDGQTHMTISKQTQEKIDAWMKNRLYAFDTRMLDASSTEDAAEIDRLVRKAARLRKRYEIDMVVFDNLMCLVDFDEKDFYSAQSKVVRKLVQFAIQEDSVALLVAHPRKSGTSGLSNDSISGTANITNLAAAVLTFEDIDQKDREEYRKILHAQGDQKEIGDAYSRKISVTKARHGGRTIQGGNAQFVQYDSVSKRVAGSEKLLNMDYLRGEPSGVENEELPPF